MPLPRLLLALALTLQAFPPIRAQHDPSAGLRTLVRPGLIVHSTTGQDEQGRPALSQEVSRAGRPLVTRALDPRLHLRCGAFDPMTEAAPIPSWLRPSGSEHLVQLRTQVLPVWLDELRESGLEILRYVPHQALVVEGPPGAVDRARALDFVRWMGPHCAGFRLEPRLLQPPAALPAVARYSIQLGRRHSAVKSRIRQRIRSLGGRILDAPGLGWLVRAELSPDALHALAAEDGVAFIDRWLESGSDTGLARRFSGAVEVETFGYRGAGVRAEILDGGLDPLHPAFAARPPLLHGTNTPTAHGTSSYGIAFGDGTGNPGHGGILADGQGLSGDFQFVTDRLAHSLDLVQPPYEAVYQSNAWGHGPTLDYTTLTFEIDAIAHQLDLLILQSQSNWGSQLSRAEAWAKNLISVGAINGFGTLDPSDDAWAFGASIGPAADGRIKPDLAHFGDGVPAPTQGGGYAPFTGTSAAVSVTGGLCGLIFQMWADGIFGNAVSPGAGVFANRPHLATIRALAINAARPWEFSGTSHDLTRMHQGWGRIDLTHLYRDRHKIIVVDESAVLSVLQTRRYTVTVPACEPELRVTLAWTDPPGTTAASIHRINDLDLRVTDPSGQVYLGNVGLDIGNQSSSGGTADDRNTVENVWIPRPVAGTWLVEVVATEINQDGHLETAALDADFALVMRGVQPPNPAGFVFDLRSCPGSGDLHLDLRNLPPQAVEGFTLISAATHQPLGAGAILGLEPDHLTWLAVGTAATPTNPFHWAGSLAPSVYPLGSLSYPPGTLATLTGFTIDACALALDAQGNFIGPTNLVRREL